MSLFFLGDTHEQQRVIDICKANTNEGDVVLSVGDNAFGFGPSLELPKNLLTIAGNHDNPSVIANSPNFLGRWGKATIYTGGIHYNVLYISGAGSTDKDQRISGIDWWRKEELGYTESNELLEFVENRAGMIDIVLSHDCPKFVTGYYSHTTKLLQEVHNILENRNRRYYHIF